MRDSLQRVLLGRLGGFCFLFGLFLFLVSLLLALLSSLSFFDLGFDPDLLSILLFGFVALLQISLTGRSRLHLSVFLVEDARHVGHRHLSVELLVRVGILAQSERFDREVIVPIFGSSDKGLH